jgi:hypothetical protein
VSWLSSPSADAEKPREVTVVMVSKNPGETLYPDLGTAPGVTLVEARDLEQCGILLDNLPTPLAHCDVAVSGSPGFVKAAKKTLTARGARHIQTDRFIGY